MPKFETNETARTLAFAVIEVNTFVKLLKDVTFTFTNAFCNPLKLTNDTLANAFCNCPKFTVVTFANAFANNVRLTGVTFASLLTSIDKLVEVISDQPSKLLVPPVPTAAFPTPL